MPIVVEAGFGIEVLAGEAEVAGDGADGDRGAAEGVVGSAPDHIAGRVCEDEGGTEFIEAVPEAVRARFHPERALTEFRGGIVSIGNEDIACCVEFRFDAIFAVGVVGGGTADGFREAAAEGVVSVGGGAGRAGDGGQVSGGVPCVGEGRAGSRAARALAAGVVGERERASRLDFVVLVIGPEARDPGEGRAVAAVVVGERGRSGSDEAGRVVVGDRGGGASDGAAGGEVGPVE